MPKDTAKSSTKTTRPRRHTPFTLPLPGFGQRRMTSADFETACAREGITVERRRLAGGTRGMYRPNGGKPFITIDTRLRGAARVAVEFHELAHHFLHRDTDELLRTPDQNEEFPPPTVAMEWAEVEAAACALVAVAPGFPTGYALMLYAEGAARFGRWARKGGAK